MHAVLCSGMSESDESMRPLLAICVGNTRTRYGRFERGELLESGVHANEDAALAASLAKLANDAAVVFGSVNDPVRDRLAEAFGGDALRLGVDLAIPLEHKLSDASSLGQDRALNAIGAYAKADQACIVVDAGTAITVDFVDGEGVFHGGGIAPGAAMMLRAMSAFTSALPVVPFEPQRLVNETLPFGEDTADAMHKGVVAAVRGMVRELTDRYAAYYEAYPQIIATGGDAQTLFGESDLVEHIVPDLQLVGVQRAVAAALEDSASS